MNIKENQNHRQKRRETFLRLLLYAGLVFCLTLIPCLLPQSAKAAGASIYFSPSSGTFTVGSTFDVSVFINTGGEDVNAVEINVKFDPKKLQVASPTAGRSFIEVWVSQPTYDNVKGEIIFLGGIPSPGINTTAGLVSTLTFRVIAPGETAVLFSEYSRVLRNDPEGTNILTSMGRAVYNLVIPPPAGPKVFSLTHADTNKWYKDNNPTFCWEKEEGITDFSYSFDRDSMGIPDNVSEGDHTCVSYSEVGDGIWYFHVKVKKDGIWGGTSHYSVQIDASPPAIFTPTIEPALRTIERQPLIFFITTDALSGISYYELKYINITPGREEEAVGFFSEVSSPHKLPALEIGKYLVVVMAYDMAGNWREGNVKIEILSEGFFFSGKGIHYRQFIIPWWFLILILIITLIIILRFLWKEYRSIFEKRKIKLEKMDTRFKI